MQQALKHHPYIKTIRELNLQINDRLAFHKAVEPILIEMGKDDVFLSLVAETNFYDKHFLQQKWSLYNIPCLYVYEDEDMYLKIHFFRVCNNTNLARRHIVFIIITITF